MRNLFFVLLCMVSFLGFSQEEQEVKEKFLPVKIDGKDAFLSTKTGEYTFLSHEKANPEDLQTTESGVVYTETYYHTVQKKENLFRIAKAENVSVEELMKFNKLKDKKLSIGQKLKIVKKHLVQSSSPTISYDGEERIIAKLQPNQNPWEMNSSPPGTQPATAPVQQPQAEGSFHTVKGGDTLFSIAKQYNLTVDELKSLNNLSLNTLSVGQKLKVQ